MQPTIGFFWGSWTVPVIVPTTTRRAGAGSGSATATGSAAGTCWGAGACWAAARGTTARNMASPRVRRPGPFNMVAELYPRKALLKFAADCMLGTLAKWLIILGH